ncbi:MAG TPA: DEAD/DEAH box helicase [Candidatus Nanoarchaeia archaeon]|nr:DEAD/DEAH box helicase [Candidatus Nanoarchaeia archaeon]
MPTLHFKNFVLDRFQVDAIEAIDRNFSVVVSAPTGCGKTLIADYIIDMELKRGKNVVYTAPIKALSNQKYKDFCKDYGKENIGLVTGDTVINSRAPILIMTTEIYRNMVIANDEQIKHISYVIFDEVHFINDIERGHVWEESIIFSPEHVRFLCLSATIPNAHEFANWIQAIKKHEVKTVYHDTRVVPLVHKFYDTDLGIATLKEINDLANIPDYNYIRGKQHHRKPKIAPPSHINLMRELAENVPCLYFVFSRADTQKKAAELSKHNPYGYNPKVGEMIREKLTTAPPQVSDLNSTRLLRECLPKQIGFHHAGLLPVLKDLVEDLFGLGLIKTLYTTETFAVGINMPAKTVCFESLRKFDGHGFRFLNTKEYFQIAGRAGRRGIDKTGLVVTMIYRPSFDLKAIRRLTTKDTEPIRSQFRLSINTVLNLIDLHSQQEIDIILTQSFLSFQIMAKQGKRKIHSLKDQFVNKARILEKRGYIIDGALTEKGKFASKIYSDEIYTTEIFQTDFIQGLDDYSIMVLFALLAFEEKESTEFRIKSGDRRLETIRKRMLNHTDLRRLLERDILNKVAALVEPCINRKSFFDALEVANLLEGDLIRYFSQIIDRIGQVRRASTDYDFLNRLDALEQRIRDFLGDVMIL